MEDSRSVGHAVETVLGLRAMERMGGHAKNIAGYVVFLVKGVDVRHEDLNAVAEEVLPEAG
jgi:phosphate transport system protein